MGGTIGIPGLPANNLVPGVYFGVDASGANDATERQRVLLIGQPLSSYALSPTPVLASGVNAVRALVGIGSMLALMYEAFYAMDPLSEVWLLPLSDDPVSTKAGGSLGFNGQATADSVLPLYIAGQYVPVLIPKGTMGYAASGLVGIAINQLASLPVTAASATGANLIGALALTAKNGGLLGNDIDIRLAYLGAANGEALPPGLTVTVPSSLSTGQQNPTSLAAALANCGDMPFDFICCPYTDTASLNAIQSFLAARWTAVSEVFGHAFTAFRGTVAQRTTFSAGRNDPHTSVIGFYDSPSPVWAWAAWTTALASCCVASGANGEIADPALAIEGMIPALAPPIDGQDVHGDRDTLLHYGMGTFLVRAGQVTIDRLPTTYTTNVLTGAPDDSFRDTETDYTLMAIIRFIRIQLQTQFARKKLVADGTNIAGGSNMVTSQTVLATVKAIYRYLALTSGLCQNPDQFDRQAQAENAGGGMVKLLLPVQLANQLRVIAGVVRFTKP